MKVNENYIGEVINKESTEIESIQE